MALTTVKPSDLRTGDVLLYGGDALISRLIMIFDRPVRNASYRYSHAAIYDGKLVVEAISRGVASQSYDVSTKGREYVHIYRPLASGFTPEIVASVAAHIQYYVKRADSYGYEQIMLLAFLAATRTASARLPLLVRQTMRHVLDEGAAKVSDILRDKRQPLICSELVYRCFTGAKPEYAVALRGVHVASRKSIRITTAMHSPDHELARSAKEFVRLLRTASGKSATVRTAGKSGVITVPDFVTPNDLANSPSFTLLGSLQLT